jgi:hypothetical protein
MPTEVAGDVEHWDGWSLHLPNPCLVERNADGSWSAWDDARTVDVHIVSVGGGASGGPISAADMLGEPITAEGDGWVGAINLLREPDEHGDAFRFTVVAADINTLVSCWIAYRLEPDRSWAEQVARSPRHRT